VSGLSAGWRRAGDRADAGVSALVVFDIGLGTVTLALATGLAFLLRPLAGVLEELCGTKERGDCWTAVSAVSWVAGSLLVGLLGFWWGECHPPVLRRADAPGMAAMIWSGTAMVRWALAGMLVGVAAIAAMARESIVHIGQ
jgi:hypothetical protein